MNFESAGRTRGIRNGGGGGGRGRGGWPAVPCVALFPVPLFPLLFLLRTYE